MWDTLYIDSTADNKFCSFFSQDFFLEKKLAVEMSQNPAIPRNLQQVVNKNIIVIKLDAYAYEEKQNVKRNI